MIFSRKASSIAESSTLAVTNKVKKMKAEGIDVIGFTVGEPDFDTPDNIKQAAVDAISNGFTKYTAVAGTLELREAIAKKLYDDNGITYTANQIVVSNGAKHALANTFAALLNDGDEVIIPAPYWLSYPEMVKLAGGVPIIVQTVADNGFKPTLAALEAAVTPKTKAIIINSPSNPTGMLYTRDELAVIAKFAITNDIYVVSDEIYEKLTYDGLEHISIASLGADIFERTIVVNGLSKSHAMTGWRVGYTACCAPLASIIANVQSHLASNVNSIAQAAALVAVTDSEDSVAAMCVQFEKRRNYIYERVLNIPHITALKPQGAFYVFVDISAFLGKTIHGVKISTAQDLEMLMLDKCNVAVVSCNDFGAPGCIRLSYAMSMEVIEEGLNRIEAFVRGTGL